MFSISSAIGVPVVLPSYTPLRIFTCIGLIALRDELGSAGAAAIQVVLDVGLAQIHAGRAAVDDAADGRAVGFTEVGDGKGVSESIAAHGGDYPRHTIEPGLPIVIMPRMGEINTFITRWSGVATAELPR